MNITNKVKIFCEEAYAETIWCKELLGGLHKELKKRRLAFELCTKSVVPTPEGKQFYEYAKQLLRLKEKTLQEFNKTLQKQIHICL